MKLWDKWRKKSFGKKMSALHAWNAWLVLLLAVSGILLFIPWFREWCRTCPDQRGTYMAWFVIHNNRAVIFALHDSPHQAAKRKKGPAVEPGCCHDSPYRLDRIRYSIMAIPTIPSCMEQYGANFT